MQKSTTLQFQLGKLITGGLFHQSLNINYFGEFLIYLAFALLPMNWFAFLPLSAFIVTFWISNMVRKDRILSTLPGFPEYKKKTWFFIPFVF
jgi:protein-S-isoprenylcysteine O-methyltransferase Ste14